jgi:hypothetical protein
MFDDFHKDQSRGYHVLTNFPKSKLSKYQKALEINPNIQGIKEKINSLKEKIK